MAAAHLPDRARRRVNLSRVSIVCNARDYNGWFAFRGSYQLLDAQVAYSVTCKL